VKTIAVGRGLVACYGGMRMRRTGLLARVVLLVALSSASVTPLLATDARASASIPVTWDRLLRDSLAAAVVSPLDSRGVWEGGRIYTYTRGRVDRSISGQLTAGAEVWVRTMGGVVGKIGQVVEGEAVLGPGQTSLLFLRAAPQGTYDVTARGQGQFPVVADDPSLPAHVIRSRAVGALFLPHVAAPVALPQLAADLLHGRSVDDAAREITTAWDRTHAH
jgi:hypothetical protein